MHTLPLHFAVLWTLSLCPDNYHDDIDMIRRTVCRVFEGRVVVLDGAGIERLLSEQSIIDMIDKEYVKRVSVSVGMCREALRKDEKTTCLDACRRAIAELGERAKAGDIIGWIHGHFHPNRWTKGTIYCTLSHFNRDRSFHRVTRATYQNVTH